MYAEAREAGLQVHLLLFMVALFHIVTAAVILVIANLRMRSWWRWKQDDDQEARLCGPTLILTQSLMFRQSAPLCH